jgi:hypothetical protein
MKTKTLLFIILVSMLAGCTAVDDVVRISGNVIGGSGDDTVRNTAMYLDEMLRSKPVAQSIDELARTVATSGDDVFLGGIRSTSSGSAPLAIRQISGQLNQTQDDILRQIQQNHALDLETSLAFLDSTCNVVEYIEIYGEAPSPQYALFSLYIFMIENELPEDVKMALDLAELSNDAVSFGVQLAEDHSPNVANIQAGAELAFGLVCLIPE